MLIPFGVAFGQPTEAPRCSESVAAALAAAPRAELVARWAELCPQDPNYEVASLLAAPPELIRSVELQTLVQRSWQVAEWCPGGQPVISQATKLDDAHARPFLYEKCLLHRLGMMSEAEFEVARGPLWTPWLAAVELRHGGLDARLAAPLVRTLARP